MKKTSKQRTANSAVVRAQTVYYDGDCPVCRREIAHYRSMTGAQSMSWENVATSPERVAPDLMRSDALARMHVRTSDGELVSGVRAFAIIWQAIPKTRWLGYLASRRSALWLLEPMYNLFLKVRPLWRRKSG